MRTIFSALGLALTGVLLSGAPLTAADPASAGALSVTTAPADVPAPPAKPAASAALHKAAHATRDQRMAAMAPKQAGLGSLPSGLYIPMLHPGMTGGYDIAGWHASKPSDFLHSVPVAAPAVDAPGWYIPNTRPGMRPPYDLRKVQGLI